MPPPSRHDTAVLELVDQSGLVRPRDLAEHGIPRMVLHRLVARGELERVARGVYGRASSTLASGSALGVVAKSAPEVVVCLATALQLHGLSTWIHPAVWIAVRQRRHPPRLKWPPLHVVYVADALMEQGVEERVVDGVPVRVTTPARTVADCFKWRSLVGLDVAIEALRAYLEQHRQGRAELRRMGELCRVTRVMRPYLEAMP
jgi:predicted transcriptional regulator of viral defense system